MIDSKVDFSERFIKRYSMIMGDELEEFLTISRTPLPQYIRVNTLKSSNSEIIKKLGAKGWSFEQ